MKIIRPKNIQLCLGQTHESGSNARTIINSTEKSHAVHTRHLTNVKKEVHSERSTSYRIVVPHNCLTYIIMRPWGRRQFHDKYVVNSHTIRCLVKELLNTRCENYWIEGKDETSNKNYNLHNIWMKKVGTFFPVHDLAADCHR